jgi:stalled ribosome rescue protein Dom34
MRNLGVWIDKDKAHIVTINGNNEELTTIDSNVEHFHVGGGSGSKLKGGPQNVVQDSKYLEREKHQLKSYFKEVASKIETADAVVIFGPAEMNINFKKELENNYKKLNSKVKAVNKADSMTNNQVIAWVRDFYS